MILIEYASVKGLNIDLRTNPIGSPHWPAEVYDYHPIALYSQSSTPNIYLTTAFLKLEGVTSSAISMRLNAFEANRYL